MASYGDIDKNEIIEKYKINENDRGSAELQVAFLTYRINHLVEHLKKNKHDNHTRNGLLKLVGRRKKLTGYLQRKKPAVLQELKKKLKIK